MKTKHQVKNWISGIGMLAKVSFTIRFSGRVVFSKQETFFRRNEKHKS